MKKSKLQVLIEFISNLNVIRATKKPVNKVFSAFNKNIKVLAAFLLIAGLHEATATTYYTRTSGNWNVAGTWSTSGYGSPVNTGTFPIAGDVVNIGDGYNVTITGNAGAATVNIGQGVSGRLSFMTAAANSLAVSGSISVNTGAVFNDASVVNATRSLIVGGNFANFGTVDLYISAASLVNLTFNGGGNSIVSGSGTWDLNTVNVSKTSNAATVTAQQNAFENAIRVLFNTRGTFVHDNAGTYNVTGSTANYTISRNSNFQCLQGNLNFASTGTVLYLQGGLYVNGGNVTVGSSTSNIGIATQNTGLTPYLEVTSGTLDVKAGISYNQGVPTPGSFSFRMTGGTITLNTGTTGSIRNLFYVNDVAGSIFDMSGGTIIMQRPNVASVNVADFSVCGSNGTVTSTGGTIQFGNASTPAGSRFNFVPFAGVTQPHFRITGNSATAFTLAPSNNSTANFKLLSLYIDFGKTFDVRSVNGAFGDSKQMTLLSTCDGVNAFYNDGSFRARTGTVTFNTSGAQSIGGTTTTTFYNLSINNANGITLNRAANVQNFLALVNGILYTTSANVLTILNTGTTTLGASNTYVNGPMVHTVASASTVTKIYPIGKAGAYRPVVLSVQHTNATSVTYRAEIFNSPASGLPFSLPANIANVSNVRYVQFARQAVANFFRGTIQMYYDIDDGVQDYTSLLVAHDDGVSAWQNFGGTATANITGNITSASFNNFHTYFALGNPPGGGNPLPIELTSFTARMTNTRVAVSWSTASELNNDYFTVERSPDNQNYTKLTTIPGNGTSSQSHDYEYDDPHPLPGMSYYRLRQTDYDGTSTIFGPIAVFNPIHSKFDIYPNPSPDNVVSLSFGGTESADYVVSVQDITGKTIPSVATPSGRFGEMKLVIDQNHIAHGGIFIVTARTADQEFKQRLLISAK